MTVSFDAPKQDAYEGEWFKFRIHYGIVNAGYATRGQRCRNKQQKIFHCGVATTGMTVFSKWTT
jgi:hypothetical protein